MAPGQYACGGPAEHHILDRPAEELIAMLLTQLVPTSTGLVRREMRVLTYQAFTE